MMKHGIDASCALPTPSVRGRFRCRAFRSCLSLRRSGTCRDSGLETGCDRHCLGPIQDHGGSRREEAVLVRDRKAKGSEALEELPSSPAEPDDRSPSPLLLID